jgi:hypothetical protein
MTQIAATASVVAQPINPTLLFGKIAMPGALQIAPFRQIWGTMLLIHMSRWIEITVVGWVIVEATGSPSSYHLVYSHGSHRSWSRAL